MSIVIDVGIVNSMISIIDLKFANGQLERTCGVWIDSLRGLVGVAIVLFRRLYSGMRIR